MSITEQKLEIETYVAKDMGWGYIDGMRVLFPSYMTKKETLSQSEILTKIARYCANKISYWLLTDAKSFMEKYQEKHPFDLKYHAVYLSYAHDKTALLRLFEFQNRIDISPYISFEGTTNLGFTLSPGHFSDFLIAERTEEGLFGYTKDFLYMHFPVATEYLEMYCKLYREILHENNVPLDFEEVADYHYLIFNNEVKETKEQIRKKLEELTNINRKKRIDLLHVNGNSIYSLLLEYKATSSLRLSGNVLYNIAIQLGKPTKQVENYIEKIKRKK